MKPFSRQSFIQELARAGAIIALSGLSGLILLSAAYMLPVEKITKTALADADLYLAEGDSHKPIENSDLRLDGFSDSVMLGIAAYDTQEAPMESAMGLYRLGNPGMAELAASLTSSSANQNVEESSYSRYWHGYLIFLKPALYLGLTYSQIRILNLLAQIFISGIVVYVFFRRNIPEMTVPLLLAYAIIAFPIAHLSMQYSWVLYVALFGIILASIIDVDSKRSSITCFLVIGIATSFFDLLTYPLITLGTPLVVYLYRFQRVPQPQHELRLVIMCVFFWCLGYFGMWASKWIIGSFVLQENIFTRAFEAARFRTSSVSDLDSVDGIAGVITLNLKEIPDSAIKLVVLCWLGISTAILMLLYQNRIELQPRRSLPYMIISLMPLVWWIALQNHSAIHSWMTFRISSITVFAVSSAIFAICRRKNAQESYGFNPSRIQNAKNSDDRSD